MCVCARAHSVSICLWITITICAHFRGMTVLLQNYLVSRTSNRACVCARELWVWLSHRQTISGVLCMVSCIHTLTEKMENEDLNASDFDTMQKWKRIHRGLRLYNFNNKCYELRERVSSFSEITSFASPTSTVDYLQYFRYKMARAIESAHPIRIH